MSSLAVTQDPVSAVSEQTQHAFAAQLQTGSVGRAEAAHLMAFLCQTQSAKQPQTLLPPQGRDQDAA
ncbi:hypothetical protein [Xanthomonas maliensis]|uniref:hypothetical protein n=1 Tax=Xanthomonas maliensis TaxID=1321368 RepID=UPI00039A3C39|nr:hypothetical protein [Xanthomonas maliensis]KAB7772210.1 hypothetical protein CKY51_01060 [Xanthomonas maliensis]